MATPILRQMGDLLAAKAELPRDPTVRAGSSEAEQSPVVPGPQVVATPLPTPGVVSISRKYSEIAGEYRSLFDAANISSDKLNMLEKLAAILISHKATYVQLEQQLGIPWHFTGLLHCMESNFNFGTHLHNGDSLMHRTKRVPVGRPNSNVGDPPFSWLTSAADALTMMNFHIQTDWSLTAQLFRLEQYNGFGYRFRGIASPYLWSFSDRYVKGKFVADGRFDGDVVSKQCGAAVLLKNLKKNGQVQLNF
ncbi:hypothetical protein LP414_09410 [Polaromonas sp. P1(28)-13]|nr:hypothetical protein LP414_09410 [Polaromonas sp. P1(28)-13]